MVYRKQTLEPAYTLPIMSASIEPQMTKYRQLTALSFFMRLATFIVRKLSTATYCRNHVGNFGVPMSYLLALVFFARGFWSRLKPTPQIYIFR